MESLHNLIRGDDLVVAPLVLNPMMARMAKEAGFKAGYLSGGSLGWYKCVTEANITLPERLYALFILMSGIGSGRWIAFPELADLAAAHE